MENIKKCKICGADPKIQSDELGIVYRLICPNCHVYTEDRISPSATLEKPTLDEDTYRELIKSWNALN